MANPYKFSVYRNAALNTGNSALAVITFDTKVFDTGTNIDVVTNKGRFTAPIAGFYFFTAQFSATYTTNDVAFMSLLKNGTEIERLDRFTASSGNIFGMKGSFLLQLAANDYVEVASEVIGAARAMEVGAVPAHPTFTGFLVSAT